MANAVSSEELTNFMGILGSGAREHALAWRLKKDNPSSHVQFAFYPGNDYLAKLGVCVDRFEDLVELAQKCSGTRIIVIGSELYAGIADEWIGQPKWVVWGPTRAAAQLEWSKIFSKKWMQEHAIPTAKAIAFTKNKEEVARCIPRSPHSVVMKYDGLLGGKGVLVVRNKQQALDFYQSVANMAGKHFTGKFVFEEKLEGVERTLFLFVDRKGHVQPGPLCMDFKAKWDGNKGPNTGGMGSFTPAPIPQLGSSLNTVVERISEGLKSSGLVYAGVLYVGLMLTSDGPKVLEFNVRLGDPEAQTFLPCLKTSLWDVMLQSDQGKLTDPIQAVAGRGWGGIVCATQDYAESPKNDRDVLHPTWLDPNVPYQIFFSGLKSKNDVFEVGSGRIATIVYSFALDAPPDVVLSKEQAVLAWIQKHGWKHIHYRKDLGQQYVNQREVL